MSAPARISPGAFVAGIVLTAALVAGAVEIWFGLQPYLDRTILVDFPLIGEVVAIFLFISLADWVIEKGKHLFIR